MNDRYIEKNAADTFIPIIPHSICKMPAKNLFFLFHKPIVFLLLIFVAGSNFLLAQGSLQETLQQLMESRIQDNPDKIPYLDRRNDIAVQFKEAKTDSVILLLDENILLCRKENYKKGEVDATRILGNAYETKRLFNDALITYDKAYALAKKAGYPSAEARILNNQGSVHLYRGNYADALEKFYASLKIAESIQDKETLGIVLNNMANLFYFQEKMVDAEAYYQKALVITKEIKDSLGIIYAYNNLGELYLKNKDYNNAIEYLSLAGALAKQHGNLEIELASGIAMGKLYDAWDSTERSAYYFEEAIQKATLYKDPLNHANALIGLAGLRHKMGLENEAIALAKDGVGMAAQIGQNQLCRDGHELLSDIYETKGDGMAALSHYRSFKLYADSLNNLESERMAATQQAEYAYSKRELQFQRKTLQQRWLLFSILAGFVALAIIALLINRNRRRLNSSNLILQDKNREIEAKKEDVEETLKQLKATQSQLVHAEKMASLGELTAGVAHEIQNPLNFVNNFSEVSLDLLSELKLEKEKPADDRNVEEEDAILKDVNENLERILQHGKRADAIVKSMLYHSRSGVGKKESTLINNLCEENMKLSFHGFRAKDRTFHSHYETHFDPNVGAMDVIPQDLGRVLLNLFNNAFYATWEREKAEMETGYKPLVQITTQKLEDGVELMIEDNGPGIPDRYNKKIFQPFFTTKPAGSGTGLGLSISFDIITKGHGGKMSMESEPGIFTRFTIYIPY